MSSQTESTRDERKQRYESALGAIEENQHNGDDAPGVPPHNLWTTLTDSVGMSAGDAQRAVRAGFENGDVVRYEDRDGDVRYVRADEATLKSIIGYENRQDSPDLDVIERAADALGGGE